MSTQYDSIQGPYDEMRTKSIALIEHANVKSAISPFINNATILDLACGSAYYSYDFLKWGASKVVGVDISSAMINQAHATASSRLPRNKSSHSIDFKVADCSKPIPYESGPFDVVFGAWLLNYASNKQELVEMFRNVAINLKEGGHFVSVCVPGTEDPRGFYQAERDLRPQGSGGLLCDDFRDVDDGILFHVYCHTSVGDVNFDCYHLHKHVFEAAAKEAGFRGQIQWSVTEVPEEFFEHRAGGASIEELRSYKKVPHYGMIVVAK